MLERLRHLRSRQFIALLAMVALVFAMTTYAAHQHHAAAKADDATHCQLCLQFGGAGGPGVPPKPIIRVTPAVVRRALSGDVAAPSSHEQPRSHRSRAPPLDA